MRLRSITAALLASAVIGLAPAARATGVDPAAATAVQREQAQAHFLKGKDLYDKKDFAGALTEFRASLEIVASPNARLYVARSQRELGNLVEAYVEFGRTAADAKEHAREDGRYGKAAEAALAERDAIAPKIGFVMLAVKNANDTTTINVAGSELLRAGWNDPVPVKPGSVDVEAITPGVLPVRKTLDVGAGQKVPLELDAGAPAPVAGSGATTLGGTEGGAHVSQRHAHPWMLPAAIAGAGVGVAGLLTFTIAGIASNSTYDDLRAKCGTGPCPSTLAGEVSRGKTQQVVANVGLVFGILGVAAGATFFVWWLLPPSHSGSASASLVVGPSSLGVRGTF
jgi:hypothetical protein